MSLRITYDREKDRYYLKPVGMDPVITDNIDEIGAAIAHYFRTDDARHEIFKKKGLCLFCEAMKTVYIAKEEN